MDMSLSVRGSFLSSFSPACFKAFIDERTPSTIGLVKDTKAQIPPTTIAPTPR